MKHCHSTGGDSLSPFKVSAGDEHGQAEELAGWARQRHPKSTTATRSETRAFHNLSKK